MNQYFRFKGSANFLPATCIEAGELDIKAGLPPGWTAHHTGVLRRYRCDAPENGTTMGKRVALQAMENAGVPLSKLELLIDASLTLQQPIPSNSALLQQALGSDAYGCATSDIHASCMGFTVALQAVNGLFASGAYSNALIVCSETPLRGVNWQDPASSHLMGDGAAAVYLEASTPVPGCAFQLQTFGDGAALCQVQGGAHRLPPYDFAESKRSLYQFEMDGKGVHRFASRHLPSLVSKTLQIAGATLDSLHVVPHQASGPAIELLSRRLGISNDRIHVSLPAHGNLVSAGIPFVLHDLRQRLPAGQRVLLIGTAAGYSQAAAVFEL